MSMDGRWNKGGRWFGSCDLGACSVQGRIHSSEHNTSAFNGLPLTPCSVNILGRFQCFKSFKHDHLVRCLDAIRGKQDRVFLVFEHHQRTLKDIISEGGVSEDRLLDIANQICLGLNSLHHNFIVHRCLALDNILVCADNQIRLTKYCIYSITDRGQDVDFFIGDSVHAAPEILLSGKESYKCSGSKCDVWSLGMVLLQLALSINMKDIWKNRQVLQVLMQVVKKCNVDESALPKLIECLRMAKPDLQKQIASDLYTIIENCLMVSQKLRPSIDTVLGRLQNLIKPIKNHVVHYDIPPVDHHLLSTPFPVPNFVDFKTILMNELKCETAPWKKLPIEEIYFLWRLTGATVEVILKRKGFIKTIPPILCLPSICIDDFQMFGNELSRESGAHLHIITLSMQNLIHRLESLPPECFLISLELYDPEYRNVNVTGHDLPLVVKERSLQYQLERMLLFRRLLLGYPIKKDLFLAECLIDIPPLYRPTVWATVLGLTNAIQYKFNEIDTRSNTPTDRQMEVDIPRCHQYDELLSSPEGHIKLKRVLKAWVNTHPQYVYWQGLDSLSAPFVYLHFNNLAMAYGCLSAFVPKFCHDFFMKDNAAIIQEYLAIFDLLIAFHEPQLFSLMREIMFGPELYAIPWFLTMFAHVFPLYKLVHLWDGLLLKDSVFPLCIGVAILRQLKDELLTFGFNECILLFSDLPDVDIERCMIDSDILYKSTPKTVAYRYHAPPTENLQLMYPITLADLKNNTCPRISAEELYSITETQKDISVLVLDIRCLEEYYRGTISDSVHVNDADGITEHNCAPVKQANESNAIIVVAGNTIEQEWAIGARLVSQFIRKVCILDEGMESVRRLKHMVVPSRYNKLNM